MAVNYKGKNLETVQSSLMNRYHVLGTYLETLLWPLGDAEIVGSFSRNKAFIHNKDVDVLIHTKIKDEQIISEFIQGVLDKWCATCSEASLIHEPILNLDLFVFGDFSSKSTVDLYYKDPIESKLRESLYITVRPVTKATIRFNKPEERLWLLIKIVVSKFVRSLLRT
jgi:hypothetical protein